MEFGSGLLHTLRILNVVAFMNLMADGFACVFCYSMLWPPTL